MYLRDEWESVMMVDEEEREKISHRTFTSIYRVIALLRVSSIRDNRKEDGSTRWNRVGVFLFKFIFVSALSRGGSLE